MKDGCNHQHIRQKYMGKPQTFLYRLSKCQLNRYPTVFFLRIEPRIVRGMDLESDTKGVV